MYRLTCWIVLWMLLFCQLQVVQGKDVIANIALNKPAKQISTRINFTADYAVDGDTSANHSPTNPVCAHTGGPASVPAWWQVDLQGYYVVENVTIYNRASLGYRLSNFTVLVYGTDPELEVDDSNPRTCAERIEAVGDGEAITLTCAAGSAGQFLRVAFIYPEIGSLTLCEVQVAGYQINETEGDRPFDCRRQGQDCFRPDINFCYPELNVCICGEPYEGEMCNVNPDREGFGSLGCGENGFEYQERPDSVVCHCLPGYYGDTCQYYYLNVECDGEMMRFSARPHGNFTGHIYVMGKWNVTECQLNATVLNESGIEGYELSVPHISASCGDIIAKTVGEKIHFSRTFLIQYSDAVTTSMDQTITAECTYNGSTQQSAGFAVSSNYDNSNPHTISSEAEVPLTTVFYVNGNTLQDGDQVDIGAEICVELSVIEAFSGVEIRTITFSSGQEEDATRFRLYNEGCTEQGKLAMVLASPFYTDSPSKTVIKFCFKAFRFTGSDILNVELVLRICANETSDCQVRSCISSNAKKRDVGYFTEIREKKSFHISEDLLETTEAHEGTGRMKIELIGILSFLGCLILVMAVVVVVLVRIFTRRKQKNPGQK